MAAKALPTTKQMEIIDKKEFVKVVLDENVEGFVVHMTSFSLSKPIMSIHLAKEVQITLLTIREIKIPAKYSDFSNIFSEKKALVLPELTKLNQHVIELHKGHQPLHGPIYSLDLVKLETLKTYIKTNLANSFIRPLKSPAGTSIVFVQKPDGSLQLCENY